MLDKPHKLLERLVSLPYETEWVEFKENNEDPHMIAEYISAISNSATLENRPFGYVVWGISDDNHKIIGTQFKPKISKVGGELFEGWLLRAINPRLDIKFYEIDYNGYNIVILEIPSAKNIPTNFKGEEYIRIGSYKKKLKDNPQKEKLLWDSFKNSAFEDEYTIESLEIEEILSLLDFEAYYRHVGLPASYDKDHIIGRLISENFVCKNDFGYSITNMGAILFAKDLTKFQRLGRKCIRIILYNGSNKIETIREKLITKGYVEGFMETIEHISNILPSNEEIGRVVRVEVSKFPILAIRELVANAIIHQDFSISGTGPVIELYVDRIEITNPGVPLVEILRLIDQPPRSRNEKLASFMRRIKFCEERGSGIDKVIHQAEVYQLPPPDFRTSGDNMISVLFAPRQASEMNSQEKIRACYQHVCLCFISNQKATNTTIRARFNISQSNYPMASKIIAATIREGFAKVADPSVSKSQYSYIPFWG